MTDRESQIERIGYAALKIGGAARAAFLTEACAGDTALQRDIESLLAQESAAAGFLSTPAAALIGDGTSFIGRRLGPYVIQARLGAGGMGEVYRAHDSKLGRDVAIKILPPIFTRDPERLARFEREARLLAALNHPNIGAIYGLEDVDGVPALILELVEGETLAERIARAGGEASDPAGARNLQSGARGLPMSDTLHIASQIVDALEAAHDHGIVHRDLKPANIVLRDRTVKVLDFGLAKATVGEAGGPDLSHSPTISGDGTRAGAILGTPAYMSPGQARGKPVDKRADVWAFGCILYEMLTGRLAFPGETLSDTIAAILEGEPDWRALPGTTPAVIQRLLRRCLEKDPAGRLRDIGDARLDIKEALAAPAPLPTVASRSVVRRWPTRVAWAIAATGAAATIGALGAPYIRTPLESDVHAVRFTLATPAHAVLPSSLDGTGAMALSPDGRRLAFVADRPGARLLWIRSLDSLDDATPIPGSEGGEFPFWSSDNRTVAFAAQGKLKAIDVDRGSVRTLCDVRGSIYGGAWSPEGSVIAFATLQGGLLSVPANGGSPIPLVAPDAAAGARYLFPTFLPDGRRFVYLSVPSNTAWLGSLDSREPAVRLFNADSQVVYVAPGFLVFVRRSTLMAQRFDAQHTRLSGEAVPIEEGVMTNGGYGAAFATSRNGALVYRRDPRTVLTQLTWVDRGGRRLGVAGKPGRYRNPALSPDNSTVVMEVHDAQASSSDIWRLELERNVMRPLTADPDDEAYPLWSPDGTSIMFASNRDGGVHQLYRIRADGIGGAQRVFRSKTAMTPQGWAPDGHTFIFQSRPVFKLGLLPLAEAGVPHLFDDSLADEFQAGGQVSPNGHWMAYAQTALGQGWDIYVQSFPMRGSGKWRVTSTYGSSPRWSRDGREIFYYDRNGRLIAVPVTSRGSGLEFGPAVPLFEAPLLGGALPVMGLKQQYDVASDGRFLLNLPVEPDNDQSITVVLNWIADLPR